MAGSSFSSVPQGLPTDQHKCLLPFPSLSHGIWETPALKGPSPHEGIVLNAAPQPFTVNTKLFHCTVPLSGEETMVTSVLRTLPQAWAQRPSVLFSAAFVLTVQCWKRKRLGGINKNWVYLPEPSKSPGNHRLTTNLKWSFRSTHQKIKREEEDSKQLVYYGLRRIWGQDWGTSVTLSPQPRFLGRTFLLGSHAAHPCDTVSVSWSDEHTQGPK